MEYKEFLNIFKLKGQHFMWFLGAGTSVSAGVPSASNLIDQFKLNIFVKIPVQIRNYTTICLIQ